MIVVVDVWTDRAAPPGAADDDDLFAASQAEACFVLGGRAAIDRARAFGANVIGSAAVPPGPLPLVRRAISMRLGSLVGNDASAASIWSAGVSRLPLRLPDGCRLPPQRARRPATQGPLILPVATQPQDIDSLSLAVAAAILRAAHVVCTICLPEGSGSLARCRRFVSQADRSIAVEHTGGPWLTALTHADAVIDFGLTPGGTLDRAVRARAVPRLEASTPHSGASLAMLIKRGLPQAAFA